MNLQDRLKIYHQIERVLTDFKNGATYSDSIEKVEDILSARDAEIIKFCEEKAELEDRTKAIGAGRCMAYWDVRDFINNGKGI